jgi:hypothetical protein
VLALWLRLGLGHGDHLGALGLLVIFFVVAGGVPTLPTPTTLRAMSTIV